jgi:membrane protease YdiL (CAAX protease family)
MMNTNTSNWIARYQILLFFLLTLAISWAVWIPAAVAKLHGETSILAPEGLIGGIARWLPGLIAIILSFLIFGKSGIGRLFQPMRIWRVGLFWYIFALLFQMIVFYGGRIIDTLFGSLYEVTSPLHSVYGAQAALMAPMVILFAFPGAFAEELGWRGYVLPRLQNKLNALLSSIVVAIFWGAWHIPLLIYFGDLGVNDYAGYVLAMVNFIPIAIIYTWIYNNTQGSLLLVTLFHIGQQLSNNLLGELPTITDEILVWIVAVVIIMIEGAANLSRRATKHQVAATD